MIKLGVNIDHIATLREARKEGFPSPVEAALICMKAGADGIVAHLREDRRHIKDEDIYEIRKAVKRFDMEMAATGEMQKIALKIKPDIVTLVPEKRKEVTTEGGLDVRRQSAYLKKYVQKLQDAGIWVSLFVDPDPRQIKASALTGAKLIEIHTGEYANTGQKALKKIRDAVKMAVSLGLKVNAGHGLTLDNVGPIAKIRDVEELNIGFSIIADAVFVGLGQAVKRMRDAVNRQKRCIK
ncbi:MAG: pyridoxine 5'-phosphate synthase [Candidatus Saganbacteria bacterium]|nr:pyridoxine 5'-phosphate synthase [Candidatus Saganbacteria bacterium]